MKTSRQYLITLILAHAIPILIISVLTGCQPKIKNQIFFDEALENGVLANEGYRRCNAYVHAWLEYADSETGLFPENLDRGIDRWTPHNSAADNYPFMVLVSALTDEDMFHGRMHEILEAETRLTSRIGHMPDGYSFSKDGFVTDEPDIEGHLSYFWGFRICERWPSSIN